MAGGYGVLVGELEVHAGKVDALAGRLQAAVDAARQVTMSDICRAEAQQLLVSLSQQAG